MADWNVSVDIAFLDTPLTIASTSENPKKFELQQPMPIEKIKLTEGLKGTRLEIPQGAEKYIPNTTTIEQFLVDGKNDVFKFAVSAVFGADFVLNQYNNKIFTIQKGRIAISSSPKDANVANDQGPVL